MFCRMFEKGKGAAAMKVIVFFLFLFCWQIPDACAQIVDMRARSRKVMSAGRCPNGVCPRQAAPVEKARPYSGMQTSLNENPPAARRQENQEQETKKISQTGIKIFQEKDEDKVLNFEVENPEFDKLNEKKKQDVMNRIVLE